MSRKWRKCANLRSLIWWKKARSLHLGWCFTSGEGIEKVSRLTLDEEKTYGHDFSKSRRRLHRTKGLPYGEIGKRDWRVASRGRRAPESVRFDKLIFQVNNDRNSYMFSYDPRSQYLNKVAWAADTVVRIFIFIDSSRDSNDTTATVNVISERMFVKWIKAEEGCVWLGEVLIFIKLCGIFSSSECTSHDCVIIP